MALLGEPIPDYTQNQIKSRQKIHGKGVNPLDPRTNSDLIYLNSRNAWVKFASGVKLDPNSPRILQIIEKINSFSSDLSIPTGIDTAKNFILFNAVSREEGKGESLDNFTYGVGYSKSLFSQTAYGFLSSNSSFGPTPPPGIVDLNVKALNRGSIKKSTLRIKAYNSLQFDIIDILYLRLGYTMMLEWGDSHYLNGDKVETVKNTLIEDEFFHTNNESYPYWLKKIDEYREKYEGCYDGFYGVVTNFTWELSEDGSYDISIDLHSQGDIIESLTLSTPPTNTSIERIHQKYPSSVNGWTLMPASAITTPSFRLPLPDGGFEILPSFSTPISTTLYFSNEFSSIINDYFKDIIKPQDYQNFSNFRVEYPNYNYPAPIPTKPLPTNKGTELGYVLGFVNYAAGAYSQSTDNILFKINGGGNEYTYKDYPESSWAPDRFGGVGPDGEWYFLDEIVKIYAGDNTLADGSSNINGSTTYSTYIRFGCLIQLLQKILPDYTIGDTPLIKFSNENFNKEEDKNLMYTFPNHYSSNPKVCIINSPVNSSSTAPSLPYPGLRKFKDSSSNGQIMNVYLNIDHLLSLLPDTSPDSSNTLPNALSFLSKVCDSINSSLGSVNNLEPVIDPDTNVLSIIDSSRVEKGSYDPIVLYGYVDDNSNFVRRFDLKTQISKEYATMITIGATAGGYSPGVDATAFSNWNRGIIDRFKGEIKTPNTPTPNSNPVKNYLAYTTTYDTSSVEDTKNQDNNLPSLKTFGLKSPTTLTSLSGLSTTQSRLFGGPTSGIYNLNVRSYGFLTDEELKKSQQLYDEYCRFLHSTTSVKTQTPSPTIGFLPFGINLTLDGISGVKIYNKIVIDNRLLPSNYSTSLEFVVKGVDHSIKNNDWETRISTIAVPKDPKRPEITEFKIQPTSNTGDLDIAQYATCFDGSPKQGTYTFLTTNPKKSLLSAISGVKTQSTPNATTFITPKKNAIKIANALKKAGYTKAGTQAILGSMTRESGFLPDRLEGDQEGRTLSGGYKVFSDIGGKGGYGIVQWTKSRRRNLESNKFGYPPYGPAGTTLTLDQVNDLDYQIFYLLQETKKSYPKVYNVLTTSNEVKECVLAYNLYNLKPQSVIDYKTDRNSGKSCADSRGVRKLQQRIDRAWKVSDLVNDVY
jgi:hypothetical protein